MLQKTALLEAVSYTNNGKTASEEQQANVLRMVRMLETAAPVAPISDPETARLLDGTWYLQYTSPSVVGDDDKFPDAWKPAYADEGEANISTRQYQAQGTVVAAGVTVDTSNKVVKQIFNVSAMAVANEVSLEWGQIVVSGTFRQSPRISNRAIVAFDTAVIRFGDTISVNLSLVFAVLAVLRRSRDSGWLETTYLDNEIRIGRGNKGTMFVLTRDPAAVKP